MLLVNYVILTIENISLIIKLNVYLSMSNFNSHVNKQFLRITYVFLLDLKLRGVNPLTASSKICYARLKPIHNL